VPIAELFPTPIYVDFVRDELQTLVQAEFENVYPTLEFITSTWFDGTHGVTNKDFAGNIIDQLKLIHVKTAILAHVKQYCQSLNFGFDTNYLMESWITSFKQGDYSQCHTHGSAHISGVYYYRATPDSGNIFFQTPVGEAESSLIFKQNTSWSTIPEVGKIIIFPGYLVHGVRRNSTVFERNSISFNMSFNTLDY